MSDIDKQREICVFLKEQKGYTRSQIARHLDISERQVKRRLLSNGRSLGEVVEKVGAEPIPDNMKVKATVEIHKDGSQSSDRFISMTEEQAKSVAYLLEAHGYDTMGWELVSARNNIWNVYSKQDGVQVLYSSKIVVKPRQEISIEHITKFFDELSIKYRSPIHEPTNYSYDGKMLEVNISDLHVGKFCWEGSSGNQYDYEKAKQKFLYIINDVITRTKHYKFSKILFVWSNDFFHYDTITQTTTAGTKQDTNILWQNLYKFGMQMLIEGIDLLAHYAPVETFYIGSNHDKATSYYAIEHLHAWYRNEPSVKVDTDPKSRKYVEFGKCLIGFAHGHAERKRVTYLMPVEAKEAWGRTLYREFHLGHIHQEKMVTEENGVIIRHISSPAGTDNWHFESGYVGAVKKAQSFVWDREYGLTDILNINAV